MTPEAGAAVMMGEEIGSLPKHHNFFSWSVQGTVDPIAVDRADRRPGAALVAVTLLTPMPDPAKILCIGGERVLQRLNDKGLVKAFASMDCGKALLRSGCVRVVDCYCEWDRRSSRALVQLNSSRRPRGDTFDGLRFT
jgi:hypothetical protein